MSNEHTFDLDNQPGMNSEPITRKMIVKAIEALGLDANSVTAVTIDSEGVTITSVLRNTDGAMVLPYRGPHSSKGGFLKHTYTVRTPEDDLCQRGSIDGSDLGEGE